MVGREKFVAAGGFSPLFISVWGGKEPLLSWFTGLCQGLLGMFDPVAVGRLPALLGGAAALAALVVVGRWLFSPPVAYLGGLFYLLWPYALLFNVQLQPDSLLTGEVALMLLAALVLAFAAALLTKSSALLYLAVGVAPCGRQGEVVAGTMPPSAFSAASAVKSWGSTRRRPPAG